MPNQVAKIRIFKTSNERKHPHAECTLELLDGGKGAVRCVGDAGFVHEYATSGILVPGTGMRMKVNHTYEFQAAEQFFTALTGISNGYLVTSAVMPIGSKKRNT